MWIDVIELDVRKKDEHFDFSFIAVELFHRRIKPIYPKKDKLSDNDYKGVCKYITWQTATKDIANQRILNIKGPKYLIKCTLINRNKGKVIVEDAVWNTTFQRWVPREWIMTTFVCNKKEKSVCSTRRR
ncbi:MAG: hypothetical protein Q8S15_06870 [Erysipelotrichaceae bacterium]|nr:hypothetical protein [Erysipelotrichaceae bacterium]